MVVETHFGQLPDTLSIKEYDLSVLVDFVHGHKTGFYLDQRKNRRLLGQICSGKRVLNCFSYTGAFALHAVAGGAKEVINVDVSQDALALSEQNLRANFDAASCERVQHINRDVFELLREYQANGEQFDVIVMDPPVASSFPEGSYLKGLMCVKR